MPESIIIKRVKFTKAEIAGLLLILVFALCFNLFNNNFLLGYHPDEIKKVDFIKTHKQDFRHPILMLQSVRLLNVFFCYTPDQSVVELGRASTAFYGALAVLFAYLIFRQSIPKRYALFAALTVAMSPSMVIHSHYLKEDIIFTCSALLSLLLFIEFIRYRDLRRALLFGVGLGLAISAQYKGFLLIPFYFVMPIVIEVKEKWRYYRSIISAFCVSGFTFLLVNYPIVFNFSTFRHGFLLEKNHALQGHAIKISALSQCFGFHFFNSLIPGMTLLIAVLAVSGIVYSIFRWRQIKWIEKVLLFYAGYLYLLHEIVPLKPFPDFIRYMIPIIPVMDFFAVKIILVINNYLIRTRLRVLVYPLLLLTLGIPFHDSLQLVNNLNKDTRMQAEKWIKERNKNALYEEYASIHKDMFSLVEADIPLVRKNGVDCLVVSSFVYDRYIFGSSLKDQYENVYEAAKTYRELFKLPYEEISPAYKSFAFSNPTIRIINISETKE
ncbi:MAG: phospholipid carrier-dependent glycosyltransferase [Candidatus Omnitrophota bacterium]